MNVLEGCLLFIPPKRSFSHVTLLLRCRFPPVDRPHQWRAQLESHRRLPSPQLLLLPLLPGRPAGLLQARQEEEELFPGSGGEVLQPGLHQKRHWATVLSGGGRGGQGGRRRAAVHKCEIKPVYSLYVTLRALLTSMKHHHKDRNVKKKKLFLKMFERTKEMYRFTTEF